MGYHKQAKTWNEQECLSKGKRELMPDFEKVIVHVLDCEQNTCIMSTACMQELQPEVEKMMQTKASKVFSSSSKKSGKFKESSQVKQWLDTELYFFYLSFFPIGDFCFQFVQGRMKFIP